MAAPGYSGGGGGGGGGDLFGELSGRSVNSNNIQNPFTTTNPQQFLLHQTANHHQQTPINFTYPSFVGKRTLADFHHPSLTNLLVRSVKPRMSPNNIISPEFSSQHRYPLPLPHNLCPNPNSQTFPSFPYINALHHHQLNPSVLIPDSEKKLMNQLHELEKQLLDDNDDDSVSVITTSHSEWSDTIQGIINNSSSAAAAAAAPNPVAPSPTSSSSSTSSTNSVLNCSKQTLLEAASAISEGKFDSAAEMLGRISNPKGSSEHKLMSCMLTALKARLDNKAVEIESKEHMAATHLLYQVSPCFRLSFMAANSAILDATLSVNNAFHVIDFDIGQGTQYKLLLSTLSERLNGKSPALKLTAVSENGGEEERLRGIGDSLSQLGNRLGVSFKFSVKSCKLSELSRESLGCEAEEVLAVNLAYKLYKMADESVCMENPRDHLLRRVKGLSPRVVTLVEQEMNCNTAPLLTRVKETCEYYGALLESMGRTSVEKEEMKWEAIEEAVSRKVVNSVGCEGRDRVERCEVYGKWRARMGMADFELRPISQNAVESMKSMLGSLNRPNPGFSVKEENGGICLGWMGKTLTVASAWR